MNREDRREERGPTHAVDGKREKRGYNDSLCPTLHANNLSISHCPLEVDSARLTAKLAAQASATSPETPTSLNPSTSLPAPLLSRGSTPARSHVSSLAGDRAPRPGSTDARKTPSSAATPAARYSVCRKACSRASDESDCGERPARKVGRRRKPKTGRVGRQLAYVEEKGREGETGAHQRAVRPSRSQTRGSLPTAPVRASSG